MWLYEFAYDLEKNAQNVDYLKNYLDKMHNKKKFNSIEEKLADIRERVGFDIARNITNEIEKISQTKESFNKEECGCDSCECSVKTAMKHPERDVQIMGNILNYIKDMVKHVSYLDPVTILTRCKEEEGLRFNDIQNKIDREKLISYIKDLSGNTSDEPLAKYTPDNSTHERVDDDIAEYYNHAEPSLS